MTRVPHLEAFPAAVEPLVARIRQGRRGELLKLYKVLLHSPPLAETWFDHLGAVRWETGLDGRLRELVIIRVAHLAGAAYVLRQHVPNMAEAEGVSAAECAALADWQAAGSFTPRERAALACTDAMTRDIDVPAAIADALIPHFTDRQRVELTILIATYNMHVRVLKALDIDLE